MTWNTGSLSSKKGEHKVIQIAGTRECCPGNNTHALIFCAAYPEGLLIGSKMQGVSTLSALDRTKKATVSEQRLIDVDLATVPLRERDPEQDELVRVTTLLEPERYLAMATVNAKRAAALKRAEQAMKEFEGRVQDEGVQKEAWDELWRHTGLTPSVATYLARGEDGQVLDRFVMLRGQGPEIDADLHEEAMEKLREMVKKGQLRPDDFADMAASLSRAGLPCERQRNGTKPVQVFTNGGPDGTLVRFKGPKGYILRYSKAGALKTLKNLTKAGAEPFTFERFSEHKALFEGYEGLPTEEPKFTHEPVPLPGGFTGFITKRGKEVVATGMMLDMRLSVLADGTLQARSSDTQAMLTQYSAMIEQAIAVY